METKPFVTRIVLHAVEYIVERLGTPRDYQVSL